MGSYRKRVEGLRGAVLVDERIKNQRPTIIILNVKGERIENLYGPDMRSRLQSFKRVEFIGKDWRAQDLAASV